MRFRPLASDSLGVRSSATLVSSGDFDLLIDPGVGLGGTPDGPPPHPVEYSALQSAAWRIDRAAEEADAIFISHYHHDHFVPLEQNYLGIWSTPERSRRLFEDKHVLAKHPTSDINQHQSNRAKKLRPVFSGVSDALSWVDDRERTVGPLTLRFSPPVPHGRAGTSLGWVVMVAIEGPNETVVYTSDVQGPIELLTTEWILAQDPDGVLVDGPTLSPGRCREEDLTLAQTNLCQLADHADLIVDHHLYRGGDAAGFLEPVEGAATEAGHTVDSVASYCGLPRFEYESFRSRFHETHPVERSFYRRVDGGEFADEPLEWGDWTLN